MTLATSLAGQAFTLITGVIAARALGVDGRGTLALLWLAPLILALLGGIGIPPAVTYYVAREKVHARAIIRLSLQITILLATLLGLLYALGLVIFAGDNHDFPLVAVACSVAMIPLFLGQNLAIAALLGQERFRAYNAARLIPVAAYALFSTFLVVSGSATLASILGAALASWLIAMTISWTQIARTGPDAEGETPVTRGEIMSFGVRGVVGSVSPIDDVRLDQFMVGLLLDARALGLYVAAIAFCNIQRFVAQAVGAVSYPRIASERRGPQAWSLTSRYFRIGLALVAVCTVILLLLLPVLLPLLFGEDFSDAVGLGRILLAGTFFLSVHRLLTELARGLGHPGYASISEAANAVIFLVVVFLVLSPITASGVAWAVVVGGVVCVALLGCLLLRLRKPLLGGHPNEPHPELPDRNPELPED